MKIYLIKKYVMIFFSLALLIAIFQAIAIDWYGARVISARGRLSGIARELCDYYIKNNEYPKQYQISNMEENYISGFSYGTLRKDYFELTVTISNLFRPNTLLKLSSDGLYIEDTALGSWRKLADSDERCLKK
jgi:hypothetical protein